jgi:hypothetical protein
MRGQEEQQLQPDSVSTVDELSEFPENFKILHRGGSLQISPTSNSEHAVQVALGDAAALSKLA